MTKLTNTHFTEGGTGVTNFVIEDLPLYEKAVREYNDPTILIGPPMLPLKDETKYKALHTIGSVDLESFWCIYEKLEKELVQ